MDSRSTAFTMIWKRLGGLWLRSNISVTPPLKSSIASLLEPPFRFSYEPFILHPRQRQQRTSISRPILVFTAQAVFPPQHGQTNTGTKSQTLLKPGRNPCYRRRGQLPRALVRKVIKSVVSVRRRAHSRNACSITFEPTDL